MCALLNVKIICCIYLNCDVQIFDNKRHMCAMEYLSGYLNKALCWYTNAPDKSFFVSDGLCLVDS